MKTLKGVEIFCEIIRETPNALLINEGDEQCWIPKSQIIDMERTIRNTHRGQHDTATITIPEWMAKAKGLI